MMTGAEDGDGMLDVEAGLQAKLARQLAGRQAGQPDETIRSVLESRVAKQASRQAERAASQREARAKVMEAYAPIVRLMTLVDEGLPRCDVYFKLVSGPEPTFKLEVLALASVNGEQFIQTMRTADISSGISGVRLGEEATLLINGISNQLAVASFRGGKDPLPPTAFRMLVEPA